MCDVIRVQRDVIGENKITAYVASCNVFKPGAHRPHAPGFLELFLCKHLYVCVRVCSPPRVLITNGMIWTT